MAVRRNQITTLRHSLGVSEYVQPSDRCDGCIGNDKTDVRRINIGGIWSELCPVCRGELATMLTESLT